jgi:hypothetical protein
MQLRVFIWWCPAILLPLFTVQVTMTGDEVVNVLVPTFLKQASELLSTVPTRLDQCCQLAENAAAEVKWADK